MVLCNAANQRYQNEPHNLLSGVYHTFAGGTNDILTFFRVVLLLFEALCCQAETDYRLLWDSRDPAAQTSHLLPLFGPQNLLKHKYYYMDKVLKVM